MRAWLEQREVISAFFFLTPPEYWPHGDAWQEWARMDLWNQAELSEICAGRVPGTPNRTDREQIAINRAVEVIQRGTLSGALQFVRRDDADSLAVMYGKHRHYVPAIAAEWAATRFDSFPVALQELSQPVAPESTAYAGKWPWGDHETRLLRQLSDAAKRFWKLYDPAEPDTAPTNDTVSEWLQARGVAKRTAQTMASILRAEGIPAGPRR